MTEHTEPLATAGETVPLPDALLAPLAPEVPLAPEAPLAPEPAMAAPALRPRTRWAGIVWGLVLAAVAAAGIWLASADGRIAELSAWVQELTPATAVGYGILIIGGLLLVTGLVGLLRRAQRAVASRAGAGAGA